MNEKQKTFCHEYLLDFNATRAAIAAGYSQNSANSYGTQLLSKPEVREYLSQLSSQRLKKVNVNAENVLAVASSIAQSSIYDVIEFDSRGKPVIKKEHSSAMGIKELHYAESSTGQSLRVVLESKDTALSLLFKHFALLDTSGRLNSSDREAIHERVKKAFERIIAREKAPPE